MPSYKLYYFNVKALAEPIRFVFSYANQDYEDVRIEREDWPNKKDGMPWGVMPVLEEDGKQLSQSGTILRYLGKKYGLAGKDAFDTAKCDEYVDAMTDVRIEAIKMFKEPDTVKQAEMKKKLLEDVFPEKWSKFNAILKKNGTGHLVGDSFTYADFFVAFFSDMLSTLIGFGEKAKEYPEILALQTKVFNAKGIKEWIAKRPVTEW